MTPDAALGSDAFYTLLVALAGCSTKQLVINLTNLRQHDAALLALREAMYGATRSTCDIRLVDERPAARRRIEQLRGDRGLPVYVTVESAVGAW